MYAGERPPVLKERPGLDLAIVPEVKENPFVANKPISTPEKPARCGSTAKRRRGLAVNRATGTDQGTRGLGGIARTGHSTALRSHPGQREPAQVFTRTDPQCRSVKDSPSSPYPV